MGVKPGKRTQTSESKREMIVERSLELFRTHGYDTVTVADICDKCCINVGTIYHYFGSKLGILREISRKMTTSGVLTQNVAERSLDPVEAIMQYLLDYAQRWQDFGVDLATQIYANFNSVYPESSTGNERTIKATKELAHFIHVSQESGCFDPAIEPNEAAKLIMLVGRGIVYDWCLHNGIYSMKEKTSEIMTWILKAFIVE